MNPKPKIIKALYPLFFLVLGMAMGPAAALADSEFNKPIQITTYPGEDFAATLSRDGNHMVFVSDTSGNLDLWLKFMGRGVNPPDRQLTFHSAEDNAPSFSPDGKKLAFVSNRSDPKGDIYILDLDSSKTSPIIPILGAAEKDEEADAVADGLIRLTNPGLPEIDPVWSPDQKFIYFTSMDPQTRKEHVYRVDLATKTRSKVTQLSGVNPSISPDGKYLAFVSSDKKKGIWVVDLPNGKLGQMTSGYFLDVSPRWSLDGRFIYFVRYQDDTNLDGQVSIEDNPNIWRVDVRSRKPGRFRQLTDSSTYDLLPVSTDPSKMLFTSNRRKSIDVWELSSQGLLPQVKGYGNSLQVLEDLCPDSLRAAYPCLMTYTNFIGEFEDQKKLARIRFRLARGFNDLGHTNSARGIFYSILKKHPEDKEYGGLAEIELALMEYQQAKKAGVNVKETARKSIQRMGGILQKYKGQYHVEARAYQEAAYLSLELDEPTRALKYSKKVVEDYASQRYVSGEAAFFQSQIYTMVGDQKRLLDAFVKVVQDYPDVTHWKQKAIRQILDLYETDPTLQKKVASLQAVIIQFKDIPRLAAAVQNRIGELYHENNENLLAKEAYRRTIDKYSEAESEKRDAMFALANILAEEENFEKSLKIYDRIEKESVDVDEARQAAIDGQTRKSVDKGNWELKVGEVKLARKTFLKLIDFSPETVEGHRGYIQADATLKQIEQAIQFYENRLKANPGSGVDHYALGLARTYLDPPDLGNAESEISQALAANSQQVFFHQTLGWVFEQKERAEPESNFLERAVQEYRMALALNDESRDLENENALLLNLGHGNYLLNNHYAAYGFYKRRDENGAKFFDENRAAIYHRRFGESAFKAGFSEDAISQYKKALKIFSDKKDVNRMAELNDRIALVYQDIGDHGKAVEHFSRTLDLNRQAGNELSLSRSLRNIANNLFAMNEKKTSPNTKDLNQALSNYFQAIDNLEKYGVIEKKQPEQKGLINVNVETGLGDDASTAATGFDKKGEEKLIFHYIGKIYGDFGEYERAIEYFRKKLALIPENLDPEKDVPVILEKALLQNQIGNFLYQEGKTGEGLKHYQDSYDLSRQINNRRGIVVNAANIAQVILNKSRTQPLDSLRGEIDGTIALLKGVAQEIDQTENFPSPEYSVIIKNYLGIFYHYLGFHDERSARNVASANPKLALQASLRSFASESKLIGQSVDYFQAALADLKKYELKLPGVETAVRQNLELAQALSGKKGKEPEALQIPLEAEWQFRYIASLTVGGPKRLEILLDAERLLSRLPYGLITTDSSSLSLQEDLYHSITRILFDKKQYAEALRFSEKGKLRLLISLNPPFQFKVESRIANFSEIEGYAERVKDLAAESADLSAEAREEMLEEMLAEYQEFMEYLKEEDPALAFLINPDPPDSAEIQSILRPGEVMAKYQDIQGDLLMWEIRGDEIQGAKLANAVPLFKIIHKVGREGKEPTIDELETLSTHLITPFKETLFKASSLLLYAEGPMEFLPWAVLRIGEQALIEKLPITFISSLAQFQRADALKNLYNSRLLSVDISEASPSGEGFASVYHLKSDQAKVEDLQSRWKYFGVVNFDNPTVLSNVSTSQSYIDLARSASNFQRVGFQEVYSEPFDSNFIAVNNLKYQFRLDTELSPTASLIQGLTFKGYPAILLRSGSMDAKLHQEFLKLFFANFREGNPAESLRQAQIQLALTNLDNLAWAQYRLYGFPGMTPEEKTEFAQTHFMDNAQKGAKAYTEKEWLKAIDYFEKSLVLVEFIEDKQHAEKLIKTLSQAAYNMEDYPKAIHYQKMLLPIAQKSEDPEQLAEIMYFLGILYSRAEQYDAAVEHLQQALAIYQEYDILDRLAESYSTLGIVEENALDYDQALKAFTQSEKINLEIGEDLNRGRELRRMGRIYYLRLNRYREARKFFTQAYKLFNELGEVEQIVETVLELGLVSEKEGDFDRALALYKRAASLAEANKLKLQLSKSFLYQANSHWFQGNYQDAFRFQTEALNIAEEIGDQRQQVFIYNTRGLIFWTLNDAERALTNLNLSLKMAGEIHSDLDVASANNNIGLVYRKDKKYEKSIEFFNQALEGDIKLKSKWGQGYTHRNLGMSFLRMGRLDEAEKEIAQAIDLSAEIGNQTNLVKAMLEMGNLALERKRWQQAITVFRETGTLSQRLNIKEVQWRALRGEAFCLVKSNQNPQAVQVYERAVQVVDDMRAAIKVEEFQNGFLTDKQDVYKELILLLLNLGKTENAFDYAERAKSRSFIDLLGNQKISLKNDVSQKLYNALLAQKQKIRMIEEAGAEARTAQDEAAAKKWRQNLIVARNAYQDLLILAKQENPQISNFVTVDPITLQELYGLLEDNVAMIEYLVTEEELVAWVIVKGSIQVARTPVKEKELNLLVKDYLKRIQNLAPVEDQSTKLYSWLIAPVESLIAGKRVLGIVPHGHLHYISFASLKNDEGYLVEKHPLFYTPSASVTQFTFARKFKKGRDVKVLALGNPDLGDFNYDLPLAEMEAEAIKWDFPKIKILTRSEATESWLQKHIGEYQIIHIASHGEFDPVNPLFSGLKLTADKEADGNFEVNEVFSLQINADIVTLSACQTGLGQITGGDELVGLNRAFIYAGTHSILSSMWRVSDISTAILIKHFYRNYLQEDKAEGLRKAQLQVKSIYPHPSYWAGFNLTGDYR